MSSTRGDIADLVPDVAGAVARDRRPPGWDVDAALDAAASCWPPAGERRAVDDVGAHRRPAGRRAEPVPPEAGGIRAVAAVERTLAAGPVLFPDGIPAAWRGVNFEAHGLPVGPASTVSFAVRWHGEHPAVLWEVTGDPVELTAPAVDPTWRTRATHGEALWRHPADVRFLNSSRMRSKLSGYVKSSESGQTPSGGQRRATSTRRWAKSRSTGAPVSRWR